VFVKFLKTYELYIGLLRQPKDVDTYKVVHGVREKGFLKNGMTLGK